MAIAAEDDDAYAVAASADVPHGFEDDLALVEVAGPLRDFGVSIALLGWTHEVRNMFADYVLWKHVSTLMIRSGLGKYKSENMLTVSVEPKRQLRVKGMEEMMNFHLTPEGSGRERKFSKEESWSRPSMDLMGELALAECSGVR